MSAPTFSLVTLGRGYLNLPTIIATFSFFLQFYTLWLSSASVFSELESTYSTLGRFRGHWSWLTRAPLALQIFHHLLGGGGGVFEHPSSLSAPNGRREKRKKRSKAHQK